MVIELSESGLHPGLAKELRSLGQRFAMDDVGTALTNWQQSSRAGRTLPDFIKLDRTLVPGIVTDQGKQAMVQPLVSYGGQMESHVIAEGVETAEEAAVL